MKLLMLRHAPVELRPGICYGSSDVAVDPAGTLAAARRWAAALPDGARLRTSPLARARRLADALHALRPDLPAPIVDGRLAEMDFGRHELQPWDTVPRAEFDAWLADFAHHEVGGGESTQSVLDRVADALDDERALGGHPVWVTHAGVIRATIYLTSGGPTPIRSADDWPCDAPAPGEGHRLTVPR